MGDCGLRSATCTDKSVHKSKGLGPNSAGQSGDTQGLSDKAEADSESVTELVEEGQYLEAELIQGVEEAGNQDMAEVVTKQDRRKKDPGQKG